jgi:Transcription factor WhiB
MTNTPCQENPDLWFSEGPRRIDLAKSICSTCPLQEQCYDLAVSNKEVYGVWGGVNFEDPKERPEFSGPILCRKKKHLLPEPGECKQCRLESHRNWDSQNRKVRKSSPRIRQKVGDVCSKGHIIEGDNVIIRTYDQAVCCKKCNVKRPVGGPLSL